MGSETDVTNAEGTHPSRAESEGYGEHLSLGLAGAEPVDRPAVVAGHPGVLPNFSGAETDARLVELWLRDKAPETRCQYAQDLEKFSDFSGGKPLSSVTLADLQEFAEFVSVLVGRIFAPLSHRDGCVPKLL